ncbi:MAG: DUF1189 family protein [Phycisphaeraceae bacterium]|nr:DUF1189 family protein [Phycisphaeraceae bacterium]
MAATHFHFWHGPILSFFSAPFYDDVARRWRGIGFWYLTLLVGLAWLEPTLAGRRALREFLDGPGRQVIDQVPTMTITNGAVHCDAPQPYYITMPKEEQPFLAIDTTGEITSLDGRDDLKILVTKSAVIVRQSPREIRTYDLQQVKEPFTIDPVKLRSWSTWIPSLIFPIGFMLLWTFTLIYRLLLALLLGALGLFMASSMSKALTYAASIRLAVYAMTPAIVLGVLIDALGIGRMIGCMWWPLSLVISAGYLYFAVKHLSDVAPDALADDTMAREPWDMPLPPPQG